MTDNYHRDYAEDDQPPKKKAALNSIKPLNSLEHLEQSLWLVKLPHFVANQWNSAHHDDILGTFRVGLVTEANQKTPTKQMIVNLQHPSKMVVSETSRANVETFVLKEVNNSVNAGDEEMLAFTSDEKADTFSVEGKITKSFVLRPQQSSQYRNLVRERGYQKLAMRPETHIADIKDLQRAQKQTYTVESLTSVQQELKRKSSDKLSGSKDSEAIFDPKVLRSRVIEAFERFQRLPMTQLLAYCTQTVPGFSREEDLRNVLHQYAVFNKKGDFKNTWELKEGFSSGASITESKEE